MAASSAGEAWFVFEQLSPRGSLRTTRASGATSNRPRVSPELARLARAFEAIEPSLAWMIRASGGPFASANWPEGHANSTIIGSASALEFRDDIVIGASLLAPNVRYPDHSRPSRRGLPLADAGPFSARAFGLDGVGSRRDAARRTARQARHGLGRWASFGALAPVDAVIDPRRGLTIGGLSIDELSEGQR